MLARTVRGSVLCAMAFVAMLFFAATADAISIAPVTSPTKNNSQTVTGTMDSGSVVSVQCASATVGELTLTENSWSVQIDGLSEGVNTVTASATIGDPLSATAVIVVDTAVPVLAVSTLANGAVTNNQTLNVSGVATDGTGSGVISVFINDHRATVAEDGSFSYPLTLSAGANNVTTVATDDAANSAQDTRVVKLDMVAPQITISSPADNIATNRSPVTVTGTVDESALVSFSVNGGSAQAAIMNDSSFTADAYLAQVLNTVTITATDLASNFSTVKRTITYDTTKPTLQIQDPPQDIVTNQSSYTIKGTVSDTLSDVTVTITVDGVTSTPSVTGGAFQQQVVFSANKNYQITATATDAVGNATVVTRNIIYDNVSPAITGATSTTAAGNYGAGRTINVTLAFSEPVTTTGLTIALNSGATIMSGALSGGSSYIGTFVVADGQNASLLNVTSVSGTLADSAGNQNTNPSIPDGNNIGNAVAIVVDSKAPITAIGNRPADLTNMTTAGFSFSGNEPGSVFKCRLDAGSYVACSSPFEYRSLSDGSHTFSVYALDLAGNSGAADNYSWTIDTTVPLVNAGGNKTTNAEFTRTATASDLTAITFQWTKLSGTGTVNFGSPSALTTTISASQDGSYTLRLTATDALGNSAYSDMTLVWDSIDPLLSANPAGGTLYKKAQFTHAALASDANPMTYIWTMWSGPAGVSVTFASPAALTTTISASSDGLYILRLTATDAAGNSGHSDVTLVWDTTAPTVTSNPAGGTLYKNIQFTQTATVSDLTATTYQWAQLSGPGTVTFGSPTSLATSISVNQDGSYTLRLTATDVLGNTAYSDMTLVWNTALPSVNANPAGGTLYRKEQFTQTASASSGQLLSMTYVWSVVSGPTGGGTVTFGSSAALATTIYASRDGSYTLRFAATDSAGNSAISDMNLVWDTTAPTVNANPAGGTLYKNIQFSHTASVNDLTATTYQWTQLSGTGTVTFGSPTALATSISVNQDGSYTLRLTATDVLGNTAYSDMTLVWNTALPSVNANPAGGTLYRKEQFIQTAAASSGQLLSMTYVWSVVSGPTGGGDITFGSPAALATTISASRDGAYTLRFTATDSAGNSAYSDMNLVWDTVEPVVSAGGNRIANAPLTQTATAVDTSPMAYAWSMVSGPTEGAVTLGSSASLATTISASRDGNYTLRLTATDAAGNSAYSDMTLVWDTTQPSVNAGGNKTAKAVFTQTATMSDLTAITCQWTKQSGPGKITFGSPEALVTTIAADSDGNYVLRLTVTDSFANTSFGEMTLAWDTTAPSVNAGVDKTAKALFTQTGTASDLTALTYRWTKRSGAGSITFGSPDAVVTTVAADADGKYVLRLTATDAVGNNSFSEMGLTWDTVPPIVNAGSGGAHNAAFTQTAYINDVTALTLQWSQQSGPGTITFGSPTATETTVSASAEGIYVLQLAAVDAAGSMSFGETTITWDLQPPVMEISTLPNNSFTNEAALPISGIVKDELSGVQRFSINGINVPLVNGVFNYSVPLVVGSNVITILSADYAGNSSSDVRTITFDPAAPGLTISSPGSDYKTNLSGITITGTVDKQCSIAIHVTGGGLEQSFSNVPVTGNIFTLQIEGLAAGRNSIDVVATSNANLSSTKSVTVTYDNQKPTLDVTLPAGDVRSTQDSIVISGTTSDSQTGVSVTIIKDLETYRPQVVNGSFSYKIPLAEKKVYIIAVRASDEAGNESIVKRRVIFEKPDGDINHNGKVDIADALLALEVSVGMIPQADEHLLKGDVGPFKNGVPDPDWKIDISDVVLILRIIVGSISL